LQTRPWASRGFFQRHRVSRLAQHRASSRHPLRKGDIRDKATYIALIHQQGESDFGVSFPDFLGVATAGKTLHEASRMAREALEFHIEGMLEDSEDIPEPSTLDQALEKVDDRSFCSVIATNPQTMKW
jgi:predicted RNase H-like HicB family nuclease